MISVGIECEAVASVAADSDSRYGHTGVLIEQVRTTTRAWATNSKIMSGVRVTVTGEWPGSMILPRGVVEFGGPRSILVDGQVCSRVKDSESWNPGGEVSWSGALLGAAFPDHRNVLNKVGQRPYRWIAINPWVLLAACESIGANQDVPVMLGLPESDKAALVVLTEDGISIIAPWTLQPWRTGDDLDATVKAWCEDKP